MFTGKEIMKYIDSFFLESNFKITFLSKENLQLSILEWTPLSPFYLLSLFAHSPPLTKFHAVSRTSVYIQYVPNSIRGYFRIWCEQELVIKLYMILLFWLSRLKFEQENSISFEMALCE